MNTNKERLVAFVVALVATAIIAPATALAQKGGGQVSKAGENASDLVSGWVTPLLIIAVGAMGLMALVTRNAGMVISAIAVGAVAGFFLIDPKTAQDSFEGIYKAIF